VLSYAAESGFRYYIKEGAILPDIDQNAKRV